MVKLCKKKGRGHAPIDIFIFLSLTIFSTIILATFYLFSKIIEADSLSVLKIYNFDYYLKSRILAQNVSYFLIRFINDFYFFNLLLFIINLFLMFSHQSSLYPVLIFYIFSFLFLYIIKEREPLNYYIIKVILFISLLYFYQISFFYIVLIGMNLILCFFEYISENYIPMKNFSVSYIIVYFLHFASFTCFFYFRLLLKRSQEALKIEFDYTLIICIIVIILITLYSCYQYYNLYMEKESKFKLNLDFIFHPYNRVLDSYLDSKFGQFLVYKIHCFFSRFSEKWLALWLTIIPRLIVVTSFFSSIIIYQHWGPFYNCICFCIFPFFYNLSLNYMTRAGEGIKEAFKDENGLKKATNYNLNAVWDYSESLLDICTKHYVFRRQRKIIFIDFFLAFITLTTWTSYLKLILAYSISYPGVGDLGRVFFQSYSTRCYNITNMPEVAKFTKFGVNHRMVVNIDNSDNIELWPP